MSVYRVTELIGTSSQSWEDAAATAVNTARTTLRDLRVAEVVKQDIHLDRTCVILVPPKCLLTWGYVRVDAAAFCLHHDDRRGESAGPVAI